MLHLIKEVRNIKRFNQIIIVLFEEGFDFLIKKVKLSSFIPITKKIKLKIKRREEQKPEVILRRTLERLGPTFIKLGQLLSVRPDLIPKEYCKELEKLQDEVPPIPFTEVKSIIEKESGKSIGSIFLDFDKKPLASASISQVHKAVLKNSEKVAVKVQRPDIKHIMETDIEIMLYFARLLESNVDALKKFKPVNVINEFKEWTERELDFNLEARNVKRFYENFKGSKTVYIPKIYEELTSKRLLILEFIEGVQLHNTSEIKRRKLDFDVIMKNSFDAMMTQVFVHGIFHADPHPGNIIVRDNNSIAFVDFGIVGYFDERLKNKCIDLIYGIIERDEEIIIDTLVGMGMESYDTDHAQLRTDIGFFIQKLQRSSIKEVQLSKVLEEIIDTGLKHNLRVPVSFILFGKTILTLEGVALEYDPNFNVVESAKPFVERIMLKRESPFYVLKSFVHNVHRYKKFAEDFPEKAEMALDKIQRGTFKIDIEETDIKKLALEMDRSSNRIAYGLLISAFLITSAILFQVEKSPKILEVPFLSFISFILAIILVFTLFLSIIKERFRHL